MSEQDFFSLQESVSLQKTAPLLFFPSFSATFHKLLCRFFLSLLFLSHFTLSFAFLYSPRCALLPSVMRYPGRRSGRKASPYINSEHPRMRFLSDSEHGSSMGSMGSIGSMGSVGFMGTGMGMSMGMGAPGRDRYAMPGAEWSELGGISEYEFENDDEMDSFVNLGGRGDADIYEGMRRGTPYDYGYRYAPGAFSPVQRPRAAPAGAPPLRERPAQKIYQKRSQQKMSHRPPGTHEIPTGAYATPAAPTRAPPSNAASSTPAHATSEPPPPAAHGVNKTSQPATAGGVRKADVPVAPGGGEWIEGDPFLDACICSTDCMCRKGQRVLYRARAGDNTADGNGTHSGEIRYVFKDSVGRDCGDHSGCVNRDELRRWREEKAKEKEGKAERETKVKRRRRRRKSKKKKSKTKDNNSSVVSGSRDDGHSESSSSDDASSLEDELLKTLKKVQRQLDEMKLQGRNFGMCGGDQHLRHHHQRQQAGPYFPTTAAAPPPFHGAVDTNAKLPSMNPNISRSTFQNGNPYIKNMSTNSNTHPGSFHQQHHHYPQGMHTTAFGQTTMPTATEEISHSDAATQGLRGRAIADQRDGTRRNLNSGVDLDQREICHPAGSGHARSTPQERDRGRGPSRDRGPRGDDANPRRHSRDFSDDILNDDDDVEPGENYNDRFRTGTGMVRRAIRDHRDRYDAAAAAAADGKDMDVNADTGKGRENEEKHLLREELVHEDGKLFQRGPNRSSRGNQDRHRRARVEEEDGGQEK